MSNIPELSPEEWAQIASGIITGGLRAKAESQLAATQNRERLRHQAQALWATGELRKRGIADVEVDAKDNGDSLWFEATKVGPGGGELEYFVRRAEAWEVVGLVLWLEGRGHVQRGPGLDIARRASTLEVVVRVP